MERHYTIVKTYLYSMICMVILFVSIAGYLWISKEYKEFRNDSKKARKAHIESRKTLIKTEVDKVIDYVQYKKSIAEKRLRDEVKARTDEAIQMVSYIYEQNRGKKSLDEIKQLIHDALYAVAWDNGRGYYFAEDMDGTERVNRNNPELEGKNILDLKDSEGNYIVRDILSVARSKGEGFCSYFWNKPDEPGKLVPKLSYVKYFKPLEWVIGNGKYLIDEENIIKDEILSRIEKIQYGTDGYIFVGQWNGLSLSEPSRGANMLNITDSSSIKIVRKLINVSKSGGGFVSYVMPRFEGYRPSPKISYARGIPEWQWYIGTGVYIDEIEKVIHRKQADLGADIKAYIFKALTSLFVLLVVAYMLARFLSGRIRKNLNIFSGFFKKAATQNSIINQENIHFSEFKLLATYANHMIEQRQEAEKEKVRLKIQLMQAQKMEAIGLMAGGVAHDLNNILSGIVSYPDLLLMKLPEDSKLRQPIEAIRESGIRASQVVADLLTVARGTASTRTPANLNILIEEYLDSPEYKKLESLHPGVAITRELEPNLLNISCSRVHIKKCIMNLVMNGVEAINEKGRIFISTRNQYVDQPIAGNQHLEKGEYVVLSVADTGEGIADEDIVRIFEPFYTSKVMGQSGTGLGLAVVWNTVHDHGGTIEVKSSEKETRFELFFPITREALPETSKRIGMEALKGNGEKILVVDDEPRQQDIATLFLELLGYDVYSVASGEAAIEYLKKNTVDLVMLDMLMEPGINGRKTYERIIQIHPGQKAVIVSGFSKNDEVKKAQKAGAGKFIKKPYLLEQLGLAVKQALKNK